MTMTTEEQQQLGQRIQASVKELKKRLAQKGVVMEDTPANGQHLLNYIQKNKLDFGSADHLFEAFNNVWTTGVIKFVKGKEPAALRKKNAPLPGTHAAIVEATEHGKTREQIAKEQEAKDLEAKKELQAQKDTNAVIDSFLLNAQGGRPLYGKTAEFQDLLRKNVENLRKDGSNWQDILVRIKTWTIDEYKRHERELERL
jgi:hypothetical protein